MPRCDRRIHLLSLAFIATQIVGCDRSASSTDAPTGGDAGTTTPSEDAPTSAASKGPLGTAIDTKDATAVYELIEAEIEAGEVDKKRRQRAYEAVVTWDDGSASYAFARAALAGRVAEAKGLSALDMVKEAEAWALETIERDPSFEGGAAQRMLGTLYVMAGKHTEKGDSEKGLEMLEALVAAHPEAAINHLRLAEGYVNLGDADGAIDPLCEAYAQRDQLNRRQAELLEELLTQLGGVDALGC